MKKLKKKVVATYLSVYNYRTNEASSDSLIKLTPKVSPVISRHS